MRWCAPLIVLVTAITPVLADGEGYEFRGEAVLLQTARDAQASNVRAFPRGRLTATAAFDPPDTGAERPQKADVELCWDEDKTSWTYELREEERGRAAIHQCRMILTPTGKYWHEPAIKLAQIDPKHRSMQSVLRLRPDDLWYCIEGRREEPWSDHLNPEKYRNGRLVFSAERGQGSEIVVKRDYRFDIDGKELENAYSYVIDMSLGGNVVRYEHTPMRGAPAGVNALGTTGQFSWKPVGDGRFYCQSCSYRQFEDDPDDPVVTFEMTVDEFDPNPTIPSDQFTLAGLKLEPGTVVEDKTGRGRVYKFGREVETLTTENLNQFADELRRQGFAAPERTRAK